MHPYSIILVLLFSFYSMPSFLSLAVSNSAIEYSNPMENQLDSLVHQEITQLMNDHFKVGISIGIFHQGELHKYHYGSTELDKKKVPNDQTVYEIASLTKTFTGYLLAKAIHEEKLTLDDDIRKFLKGDYPNLEFEGHVIRIRDLASHRSGLPRNIPFDPAMWENPDFDQLPFQLIEFEKGYTKKEWLAELGQVNLTQQPGTAFQYSNLGANLSAIILENIYDRPFEELVAAYIFTPNKMEDSHFELAKVDPIHLAKPYNNKGKSMPYMLDNTWAAGGLKSNLDDMMKYLSLHMDESSPEVKISHEGIWTTERNCRTDH